MHRRMLGLVIAAALSLLTVVAVPQAPSAVAAETATLDLTIRYDELPNRLVHDGYELALFYGGDRHLTEVGGDGRVVVGGIPAGPLEVTIVNGAEEWPVFDRSSGSWTFGLAAGETRVLHETVAYPSDPMRPDWERAAGTDRFATAVALSRYLYPATAPAVVLANGLDFPDALSAAPLAARLEGPLLLTARDRLPSPVAAEIKRLKPTRIVIVGGTGVVGESVADDLRSRGYAIKRIAGNDRYATSAAIARTLAGCTTAYIATGRDFPDALTFGAIAASLEDPVILVDGSKAQLGAAAVGAISTTGCMQAEVAGGPTVVSAGIFKDLDARLGLVVRFAGRDRYETAALANDHQYIAPRHSFIASGRNFPDALAAAAIAGRISAPLVLSNGARVTGQLGEFLTATDPALVTLVGGEEVVPNALGHPSSWDGYPG